MAAIERVTNCTDHDYGSLENEPIFGMDHDALFAAVKVGDEIVEYRLGAEVTDGKGVRESMAVVNGAPLRSNLAPLVLDNMVEVVGVKANHEEFWTPASAVYAWRKTGHDEKRTHTGKIKEIVLIHDEALLGVMPPRAGEID